MLRCTATAVAEMPSVSELRDAFARFDANGDGFLSYNELVGIFTRPGGGNFKSRSAIIAAICMPTKMHACA